MFVLPSIRSSVDLLLSTALAATLLGGCTAPSVSEVKRVAAGVEKVEMLVVTADVSARHCRPYEPNGGQETYAVECDVLPIWGGEGVPIRNLELTNDRKSIKNVSPTTHFDPKSFVTAPTLSFAKESRFTPYNWLVEHAAILADEVQTGVRPAATWGMAVGPRENVDWLNRKPSGKGSFENYQFPTRMVYAGVNLKMAALAKMLEESNDAAEREALAQMMMERRRGANRTNHGFMLGGWAAANTQVVEMAAAHIPETSVAVTEAEQVSQAARPLGLVLKQVLIPLQLLSLNPVPARQFDVWKVEFLLGDGRDTSSLSMGEVAHLGTYDSDTYHRPHEEAVRRVHASVETYLAGYRNGIEAGLKEYTEELLRLGTQWAMEQLDPLTIIDDPSVGPDDPRWGRMIEKVERKVERLRELVHMNDGCTEMSLLLRDYLLALSQAAQGVADGAPLPDGFGDEIQQLIDNALGNYPHIQNDSDDVLLYFEDVAAVLPYTLLSACAERLIQEQGPIELTQNQTSQLLLRVIAMNGAILGHYGYLVSHSGSPAVMHVIRSAEAAILETLGEVDYRPFIYDNLGRFMDFLGHDSPDGFYSDDGTRP